MSQEVNRASNKIAILIGNSSERDPHRHLPRVSGSIRSLERILTDAGWRCFPFEARSSRIPLNGEFMRPDSVLFEESRKHLEGFAAGFNQEMRYFQPGRVDEKLFFFYAGHGARHPVTGQQLISLDHTFNLLEFEYVLQLFTREVESLT
jgi:hypothetical protein